MVSPAGHESRDLSRRVSPREFPELMDGDCSYEDFRDCLRSLEKANRWLLGYRPTLTWLERLPRGLRESMHIVDLGSGGGDLLRQIAGWARRRGIAVQLTGIDLNPYAARAAAESTPKELGITWVTGDARLYRPEKPIDIAVSSLLAHHLEDEEIVALLRRMEATVQLGWFINDLERAEWSYRMFGLVRWHPIVRYDGPVSFRRAFRKEDWVRLLAAADFPPEVATVERWRPGRLCVGRWK
jgi:SAM-dependent methyltransferase